MSVARKSRGMALALLLICALMLSACGGAAQPTATVAPNPTTAVAAEPTTALAGEPAPTEAVAEKPPATAETMAEKPTTEAMAGGAMGELPEVDPAMVTGDIIIAGSSTVYPLTERLAELFKDEGYTGNMTIDSIGSGAGFERFCKSAETDIANASRAINAEEIEACKAQGREAIEFRVGTDALVVVVSAENDFLEGLTSEELARVFSGEAKTWADINPEYPAEAIKLFSPGTDSGTFDYFVEHVFEKDKAKLLNANPQLSEDDNVLVQGVEGSPYAIGYFGYAYYQENQDRLKALPIDGVTPSEETTEDGSYPLSRPLYMYSAAPILQEKPQVAAFLNYYLTYVNEEVIAVGYFPASDEALTEAKNNLLDATK